MQVIMRRTNEMNNQSNSDNPRIVGEDRTDTGRGDLKTEH